MDNNKNKVRIEGENCILSTCITSVASVNPHNIITGSGGDAVLWSNLNYLSTCQSPTNRYTFKTRLKSLLPHGQSIHGLVLNQDSTKLVCYGAKYFSIVDISCFTSTLESEIEKKKSDVGVCEDWILDSCWLNDGLSVCLLTAHSKLIKIDISTKTVISSYTSPDRSILYSGRIVYRDWFDLIVLGGTVHNEITIWSPSLSNLITSISGHKGVIFSVRYDVETCRICSSSDDRTSRIWQVEWCDTEDDGVNKSSRWSSAKYTLLLTLYGHKARVWDSRFLSNNRLATIGEDGGLMIWNGEGDCIMQNWVQSSLLCLDIVKLDENISTSSTTLLVSGCTDGSVCLFPVPMSPLFPLSYCIDIKEGIKQVCLTNSSVLGYSPSGDMFLLDKDKTSGSTNGTCVWKHVYSDNNISSYCVMSLSPSKQYLATADIYGHLTLFSVLENEIKVLSDKSITGGRIYSLDWISQNKLIISSVQGLLFVVHVSDNEVSGKTELFVTNRLVLPVCKERWVTCALLFHSIHLLCGDRQGSIHLYNLNNPQEENKGLDPILSLTRVHGSRGVTCIKYIEMTKSIISCGRDGLLRKYEFLPDSECEVEMRLRVVHSIRLSMDWATDIITSSIFGTLVIGFHNVYICVWSLFEQRNILKIKCWGGHRSWDLSVDENLSLVFIKDNTLHMFQHPISSLSLPHLIMGYESKTINSCFWWFQRNLIITGGEDTCVRTCNVDVWKSTMTPVSCVRAHVSSVRSICLLETSSATLLVTAGARAQIKLFSLSNSGDICELSSHMIRKEESLTRDWRICQGRPLDQPEVRYMSVSTSSSPLFHHIYTAGSDGIIRVFQIKKNGGDLELDLVKSWTCEIPSRCLLKIVTFNICLNNENDTLCITSCTDGFISFRLLPLSSSRDEMILLNKLQCHKSGINSLFVRMMNEDVGAQESVILSPEQDKQIVMCSGGDDNCLVISFLSLSLNSKTYRIQVDLISKVTIPHLHTCQITGVNIVDNYIVSCGLDNRICLMQYQVTDEITCQHISTYRSSIPDIHGLQAYLDRAENRLIVCVHGIGIELVSFQLPG